MLVASVVTDFILPLPVRIRRPQTLARSWPLTISSPRPLTSSHRQIPLWPWIALHRTQSPPAAAVDAIHDARIHIV